MKVLFVHREPSLASARVRVLNLVPFLEARGIRCETAPFPVGRFRGTQLRALLAGSDADVVVLQKKLPSWLDGLAWRACPVPIVFDYDDAILFRQTPREPGGFESATRRRRFQRALRLADGFACGNEYLASFCRAGAKPVLLAPSAVPLDVPQVDPARSSVPPRVGWLGAPHNLGELRSLEPALRDLGGRRDFTLVVISQAGLQMEGVRVEHVEWSLASQERDVASLDVGLMPLVDSPWTRGKCAYKLLQYMAAGVPAVASSVGMNADVIEHGDNGLLADSHADWSRALDELLGDPELARRLGDAGRRSVEDRFGYETLARSWKAFLEDLANA